MKSAGFLQLAAICGRVGPILLVVGTLASSLSFQGRAGETYSPLNHFVSELGQGGVSSLAFVFNATLVLSGLSLALFLLGLGSFLNNSTGRIAGIMGALSGLSCSSLGFLTMDHLFPHIAAGDFFFFCGFVSIALFTAAIALDKKRRLPLWLILPGTGAAGGFLAFLLLLAAIHLPPEEALVPGGGPRPTVWTLPAVEWGLYAAILVWLTCTSGAFARLSRSPAFLEQRPTIPPERT